MPSNAASRFRRTTVNHPHRTDLVLAIAMTGLLLLSWWLTPEPAGPKQGAAGAVLTAGLAFAAMALRSFRPRLIMLLCAAVFVALVVATGTPAAQWVLFAQIFVAYTLALRTPRAVSFTTTAVAAGPMYLVDALVSHDSLWSAESSGVLLWLAVGTAIGDATRNRRDYIAAIEERARRAEQTREEEAHRRVMQERVRIARELHDVVAHHIAVISVQAGAVSHLLDRRPDQIAPAVMHIREACDTVLTELSSIVGVLRQPGDPTSTEPTPGLQRLPELLESMAVAGLEVAPVTTGVPRDLPSVTDLAAYRIVQESLTNAHKYGAGTARLEIRYQEDELGIVITNDLGTARPAERNGYGLLGMSERVASAAGTLHTGATGDGRFVVRASMPAPATPKEKKETP